MPPTTVCLLAAGCLLSLPAAGLRAQCADGSPPPCAGRAVVARAPASVPSATDRARRFLVLPFRNVTRHPDQEWLVEGSTTMLTEALGRWQGITVVSDEKLYPALKRAGILPGSVIDVPRVRRVSEETGGWTAVTGEVISTGGRVRVTARAWDVPTNRELVRAASEVRAGGDVRAAYDSVGLDLLRSAGLTGAASDLMGATTQNLDAYQAYLRGLAQMRKAEMKSALVSFEQAVKADSTFALGWARLAEVASAAEPAAILQPMSKGAQYAARAVALSSRLPSRQRQLVVALEGLFRAQFGESRRVLEGLIAADSTDVEAMQLLMSIEMFDPFMLSAPFGARRPRGSMNRAASLAKRITELDPSRHQMYATLASIYASAGVPGAQPAFGVDREPTSVQDLMGLLRQRDHVRAYGYFFRDTVALVPLESLTFIPKDTLRAARARARAIARAWGERWLSVAGADAAPHMVVAELYALDGDYALALRAVAKAESIGVQSASWVASARRLLFGAKAGDYANAGRIADSLTAAGFFRNANNIVANGDAAQWAYNLHLLTGHLGLAGALHDQFAAFVGMVNAADKTPAFTAFRRLIGNADPEEEPGMSRAFRKRQLDSVLAHVRDYAASDKLAPWLPLLTGILADAADSVNKRGADVLRAADQLAAAGTPALAFEIADHAVQNDSAAAGPAQAFAWYRAGVGALNASRAARQSRMHPGTAVISADRAAFEWKVDDAQPFTSNLAETPAGEGEYRWEVTVAAEGRFHRFRVTAAARPPGAQPASGTLAELLPPEAPRVAVTGSVNAAGVETEVSGMQGVSVRTEFAPGVLRLVVTDKAILDALRRARPAEARFRFSPCVRPVGGAGKPQCVDEKVVITYP